MVRSWTAACLVIGDEILSGKTQDSNSHALARFLFDLGVDLKRIEVVADDAQAIGDASRRLSASHDFVFTSGGIGPTHDDITYDSLAKAFGLKMELDAQTWGYLQERLTKLTGKESIPSTAAAQRLATFPTPHTLIRSKLPIPVVVVNKNVYVLPGIPRLFSMLLTTLTEPLKKQMDASVAPFVRVQVATRLPETRIADALAALQAAHNDIKIGSYPKLGDANIQVMISVVGRDPQKVRAVADTIKEQVDGWLYLDDSHL
ncbi:molybdenum cofactor biosynthesis domain protein [Gongronella butleri]|nr:molybdenum cofactor biosynthesis domain protein [Gongronella butleri]